MSSLLDTLRSSLSRDLLDKAAGYLGESPDSVTKGFDAAVPTVLSGILNASTNTSTWNKVWDLINHRDNDENILSNLGGLFGGTSSATSGLGSSLISLLFGQNGSSISNLLGNFAGFRNSGSGSKLLSMVIPLVLGMLKRKVSTEGLSSGGLLSWLGSQQAEIQRALPASISQVVSLGTGMQGASRAMTDTSSRTKGGPNWMLWLGLLLLVLALWYFLGRGCKKGVDDVAKDVGAVIDSTAIKAKIAADKAAREAQEALTGLDSTVRAKWALLGNMMKLELPNGYAITVPEKGVERRLVTFIQDKSKPVDKTTWFDFDRILFETGSANIKSASLEQIGNIATIMKAFPNAKLKVGGYTDNTGSAETNKKLSQARAEAVVAELVKAGIDAKRMDAEGYGQEHPVADNNTEEGRELNRRVSVRVTAK